MHRLKPIAAALVAAGLLVSAPSQAQRDRGEKQQATGAIDAATFDKLMAAQELAEAGQYNEALQQLEPLRTNDSMSSYAKSQMWNFYAFIYANQEAYAKAIDAYENVLAEEGTTEGLRQTAKYAIAQMYFQTEDYQSTIRYMEEWLSEVERPTPTAYIMLAQAYYQTESYDKALSNVERASELERAAGKPIQESWLRLEAALHYSKEDYASTAETYEELVRLYPKVSYLRQLAGMYSQLGQDMKRLTTYDAVYEYGGLSGESELLNLAYMYLGQNVPYKAGTIIEQGMASNVIARNQDNIETLANAWAAANDFDKAIPTLREAAGMSDKGILWARLAGVYFDAGNYEKAAEAAALADQKGGLKDSAGNLMLMGMAYFNDKRYEDALQSFRRAKQTRSAYDSASKWEQYTMAELERLRALERARFQLQQRTEQMLEEDEGEDVIQMREE